MSATTSTRTAWPRFRMSLGAWMVLVGLVGSIVGLQYRRVPIGVGTVAKVRPVARLDDDGIWQLAWSRDRDRLAVVGWERPVEIREAVGLGLLDTIGANKKIIQFAFGPRDGLYAYAENGKTAVIVDVRAGRTVAITTPNDQPSLAFSPDGTCLATGGYGTAAHLWRVVDGAPVGSLDVGPEAGGLTPEFSPDGALIAIGHRNAATRIFRVATRERLATLPKASSQQLMFDPSGRRLAVAYVDGQVALYRSEDGEPIALSESGAAEIYTLDWSPDGSVLASAGRAGAITLWNPADLTELRRLDAPPWVVSIRFSPDGLNLHYAGGSEVMGGPRHLGVLGVEGRLYSLLNRPSATRPGP